MKKIAFAILILASPFLSFASVVEVSSDQQLSDVLNSDADFSTIVVKDGVYNSFRFDVTRSGTKEQPLTIRAESDGGVVVEDGAEVKISGSYVVLSGFFFRDGAENGGMDSGSPVIDITGDYNRVTECAFFECHNRASIASMYVKAEDRMPQYTRIDHCYFADNMGWRLYLDLGKVVPSDDLKYAMYYRIDHNYFSTPYKMGGNTGSSMRIGLGQLGYGRCLIDNNLFERQDGETELIENKSHENIYINNTFRNCRAQMSFRQGHGTIFLHNQLEATDDKYRYGGLGMWMDRHVVAGNYFSFPSGSFVTLDRNMRERNDRLPAAVVQFISGYRNFKQEDGTYATHLAAQSMTFANNTFFECVDPPINLAFSEGSLSRFAGYDTSVPFDNVVKSNIFAYSDVARPELILSQSDKNKVADNTLEAKCMDLSQSEQLKEAQVWLSTIPGIQSGDFDLVKLANSRVAEVVSRKGRVVVKRRVAPLQFEDVGASWMKCNPSEFATSGDYSSELVATLRQNILNK